MVLTARKSRKKQQKPSAAPKEYLEWGLGVEHEMAISYSPHQILKPHIAMSKSAFSSLSSKSSKIAKGNNKTTKIAKMALPEWLQRYDKTTWMVPSHEIVRAALARRVAEAHRYVCEALSLNPAPPLPVTKADVVLDPTNTAIANTSIFTPRFHPKDFKEGMRRIRQIPVKILITFMQTIFSIITMYADTAIHYFDVDDGSGAEGGDDKNVAITWMRLHSVLLQSIVPLNIRKKHTIWSMLRFTDPDVVYHVSYHVLCGSKPVRAWEDIIAGWFRFNNGRNGTGGTVRRWGDRYVTDVENTYLVKHKWIPNTEKGNGGKRRAAGTPVVPSNVVILRFIMSQPTVSYLGKFNDGRTIEHDSGFVEVKTVRFHKASVRSLMHELEDSENRVLQAASTIVGEDLASTVRILPHSGYVNVLPYDPKELNDNAGIKALESLTSEDFITTYTGSYHIWFTLPHTPRIKLDELVASSISSASSSSSALLQKEAIKVIAHEKAFARSHALFALRLQWIEPLLISLMGGHPEAIGRGDEFTRASMRSVDNLLSGFARTPVCQALALAESYDRPFVYHSDKGSFKQYVSHLIDIRKSHGASQNSQNKTIAVTTTKTRNHHISTPDHRTIEGIGVWSPTTTTTSTNNSNNKAKLFFSLDGKTLVPYLGCANVERSSNDAYGQNAVTGPSGASWPWIDLVRNDDLRREESALYMSADWVSPHNDMLRMIRGAMYNVSEGNDIRVEWCDKNFSHGLSLQAGWVPHIVRLGGDGHEETFVFYFVRKDVLHVNSGSGNNQKAISTDDAWTMRAPLVLPRRNPKRRAPGRRGDRSIAVSTEDKRDNYEEYPELDTNDNQQMGAFISQIKEAEFHKVGFEFRLLDNMPRACLVELLKMFVLIACASQHAMDSDSGQSGGPCEDPTLSVPKNDVDWSNTVADVMTMGRFAPARQSYVEKVRKIMGLNHVSVSNTVTVRDALLKLCADLHARYSEHPWLRLLNGGEMDTAPAPPDDNFNAWMNAFNRVIPERVRRRALAACVESNGDARKILRAMGPAWRHDVPYLVHAYKQDGLSAVPEATAASAQRRKKPSYAPPSSVMPTDAATPVEGGIDKTVKNSPTQ